MQVIKYWNFLRRKNMNEKQKIVAVIFLIIFLISCLRVPWYTTGSNGQIASVCYGTIFKAPRRIGTRANISLNIVYTWAALLVTYGIVLALCTDTKKSEGANSL